MASIGLIVTKPTMTFGLAEHGGRDAWRLSFEAKLANDYRQKVDLTTEERSFANLEGTLAFENADEKEAYKGHQHGSLTYWKAGSDPIFPQPASWLATIRLPGADLERLVRMVGEGLPLKSVNITADGVEYDWAPDGSEKKWDNASNPALELKGYRLFFGEPEEEESLPEPPEVAVDTDAKALTALRELSQTSKYVLYALIALFIAVLFRR